MALSTKDFCKRQKRTISSWATLFLCKKKKMVVSMWLIPPLPSPRFLETPHISATRGKRKHYTNDIEKGWRWGWGVCVCVCAGRVFTQFCWALCRPQPCRPIKLADAVQGPPTAADVPLAKHGESLAEGEALITRPPESAQISSAQLSLRWRVLDVQRKRKEWK